MAFQAEERLEQECTFKPQLHHCRSAHAATSLPASSATGQENMEPLPVSAAPLRAYCLILDKRLWSMSVKWVPMFFEVSVRNTADGRSVYPGVYNDNPAELCTRVPVLKQHSFSHSGHLNEAGGLLLDLRSPPI